MGSHSFWFWAIVLLVVILVFGTHKFGNRLRRPFESTSHPVFSSVTTRGEEAEHINEKLPKWPSRFMMLLTCMLLLAMFVWFAIRR
jgi:hypothetical protein